MHGPEFRIYILLAFVVILSASALAVEAPSSPFEPEEYAAPPESLISSPPVGAPTDAMPATGPEPSYTPSASSVMIWRLAPAPGADEPFTPRFK